MSIGKAMAFAAVALSLASPVFAQRSASACTAPAPLPPELAGWAAMRPVTAGMRAADAAVLTIGQGARATLLPASRLSYAPAPEKPGAADSHGGIFAFDAPAAGRYRVALGAGAWIDVVASGKAATSVAHGHGPDCSGVRKMVDFDLAPGRYVLQVAGNADPELPMMVTRLTR